jgi:hypothetical protein
MQENKNMEIELEERKKFEERHATKINKFMLIDFLLLSAGTVVLYGLMVANTIIVR